MKILFITHAVFLDPTRISTGNSVRGYFLAKGLAERGHQVLFAGPRGLERFAAHPPILSGIEVTSFTDTADLMHLIADYQPALLLVGYWELLELLPERLEIPVVLDVVAPRVLEALFQSGRQLSSEVQQMLTLYRKADHFLVGSERQRHFLLPWLIMAGFDPRHAALIDVLPISNQLADEPPLNRAQDVVRFVSGGVTWPWRRTARWFDALVAALQNLPERQARFTLFAGDYLYSSDHDGQAAALQADANAAQLVEQHALLTYQDMQEYLQTHCQIGVELADRNVEREYSQSFRAMEFLRAGLPLICNDYLELAAAIQQYDAGWVIEQPEELATLIPQIVGDRDALQRKSQNARRLLAERFHYQKTLEPLLRFIEQPECRSPGPALFQQAAPPCTATLSYPGTSRLRRMVAAGKRRALRILSGWAQALRQVPAGQEVVMISRSDIFPTDHGAAVKIDRTAAALSHLVPAVYLVTDERDCYYVYRGGIAQRQPFPWWLRILAMPRRWVRFRAVRRGIPVLDAFLYYPLFDWSYILRTVYLTLRHPISLFQAEFPAYARACLWGRSLFGGTVLLVEHNIEYQRLRDQFPDLAAETYAWLRAVEVDLCQRSDRVITVSERDRQQLIADGVTPERISYVPHGVDLAAFDNAQVLDVRKQYAIDAEQPLLVYHGTYMYPPNLEAMRRLAERILPYLRAQGYRCKVLAIGNNPPTQALDEDILFTGSILNLAPYLRAADIAIVPLCQGGGTRMKILDYFAAGIPVLSTAKGIEGIPVTNNVEAVIVSDADERFADAVINLLQDRATAQRIGRCGRAFVERLDWKVIAQQYLDLTAEH